MVERRDRLDPGGEQRVDEGSVEVDARLARRAPPVRLHARPRDREPIGIDTELGQQRHVFGHPPAMVGRDAPVVRRRCTLPGVAQNVSQIDGPRPSRSTPPSIWYAEVATPHRKDGGNRIDRRPSPASVRVADGQAAVRVEEVEPLEVEHELDVLAGAGGAAGIDLRDDRRTVVTGPTSENLTRLGVDHRGDAGVGGDGGACVDLHVEHRLGSQCLAELHDARQGAAARPW